PLHADHDHDRLDHRATSHCSLAFVPLPGRHLFFATPPCSAPCSLSLHDALPICCGGHAGTGISGQFLPDTGSRVLAHSIREPPRSEEHTSELQSHLNLVCRLLLEKQNKDHVQRSIVNEQRPSPPHGAYRVEARQT